MPDIARELGSEAEYTKLFETPFMPFLGSMLALRSYAPHRSTALFTREDGWRTYLPKSVHDQLLQDGLALYADEQAFDAYESDFRSYIERSGEELARLLAAPLTPEAVARICDVVATHWEHYQKTEFFYTDEAVRIASEHPTIARSLERLTPLKFTGREHLNRLILEEGNTLQRLVMTLSDLTNIRHDNLYAHSGEELVDVLRGNMVPRERLDARRRAYVILARTPKPLVADGEEAARLVEQFHEPARTQDQIRGQCANAGFARGRARVIMVDYGNFSSLQPQIEAMAYGEILVAETTSPEILAACEKASAIVTNQGGLLSHAAVVSREMGIPCIVGTGRASRVIATGDEVEIDAGAGIVRIITRA